MEIVNITSFNHTGEGIGRIDGKVIFVEKAIPGDIVEVCDLVDCKTYYKGRIKRIIEKSDDRVDVECSYYDVCGGCQLMGLCYSRQLEYKKNKVSNILKRYGDIDRDFEIYGSDDIYGYRNKINLQVNNGDVGLYKYGSKELIPITECLLVSDNINGLISLIRDSLDLVGLSNIMIREYQGNLMVQFIGDIDKNKVISVLSNRVSVIYINGDNVFGGKNLEVKLGKYKYKVSSYSFFQVNYKQTVKLYDKIKEYLGCDNGDVLDLYCGTGTIGIYVSDVSRRVIGIEINESSVRDAVDNIKLNGVDNVSVIKGDVGSVVDIDKKYDAIIVDPPRSGLDKKTKRALLSIKSEKIIYVSCDPITLARDLKVLSDSYDIRDMVLVDMFPNTYHVECVMWLCLKK